MVEKEPELKLLERAKAEEEAYNWEEAASLYEQIANYFLENDMIEKAAFAYKKLGFINIMAFL